MSPELWSSAGLATAGVWLSAALTLMVFTYLAGDNPLYRAVEHLLVGAGAAYGLVLAIREVLMPRLLGPLTAGGPGLAFLLPLLLGVLLLTRPRVGGRSWASVGLAYLVGASAGVGLGGALAGTLAPQLLSAAADASGGGPSGVLAAAVTVLVLLHFHFGQRPSLGRWPLPARAWALVRLAGRLALLAALGGVFALTALSRFALLLARLDFLVSQWLQLR